MSDFLVKLLAPQRTTHVVDVGANPIDGDPPYKHMLAQSLCSVTGFEPQPDALAKLNRKKGSLETYLPYVIGRGGPAELKVCRYPGWTSLLQPRQAALQVFPQFQSNASVTSYVPVHTHRLDEVAELAPFDFLKLMCKARSSMCLKVRANTCNTQWRFKPKSRSWRFTKDSLLLA